MNSIIILIAVLLGWFLRDLTINRVKQHTKRASKRIRGNKSSLVSWAPPKSEEETAEEKVKEDFRQHGNGAG